LLAERPPEEQEGLSRTARFAAAGAVIAVAVLAGFILFGGGGAYKVTARFTNAGQLVPGNEVLIGGVPAGSVDDVRITSDGRADVTLKVKDQYAPLREGTRAVIKQRSLSGIANRYVDLQLGPGTAEAIKDGGRIGPDRTVTAVELDQLFNLFDPPTRVHVQDFFEVSNKMIRGKGQQLNRGIHYLNPALSTSSRLFRELDKDEGLLTRFLVDSSRLVGALSERRSDLTGVVRNLNATFGALARQQGALGESVERLPPFMRRANTTFVNLRAALNDVDPLVTAAKPVARRLGPLLSETRGLAHDAKPTIIDLSRTIRRRGASNDLIELVNSFPQLASIATVTRRRSVSPGGHAVDVGTVRGAFPEATEALRRSAPIIAFGRPYTNDLLGWFDDFSTTGGYDALGNYSRAGVSLNEVLSSLGGNLGGGSVKSHQFRRCPGGADTIPPDGTNLLTAAEQAALNCNESDRAPGPPQ
jgi:phospholipid/cholesterol/gamma-HCH transport system substrate-binding protein